MFVSNHNDMTRQDFIDKCLISALANPNTKGLSAEELYRFIESVSDERAKHCPFEEKIPMNLLDTAVNAVRDAKQAVVDSANKLPDEYWKDAPEWAEWVAMDKYGYWCCFRRKPTRLSAHWTNFEDYYLLTAPPAQDWTKSLTPRPCK